LFRKALTLRLYPSTPIGYIVVEELIAIVEKPTRKIVIVFPRWGEQRNK